MPTAEQKRRQGLLSLSAHIHIFLILIRDICLLLSVIVFFKWEFQGGMMNRRSVHHEGRLSPCEGICSVLQQIITIRGCTAVFPVVRLFSYQGGILQILNRSLDGTAGQRQICGYGLDSRPRFAFFVLSRGFRTTKSPKSFAKLRAGKRKKRQTSFYDLSAV